MNMARIVFGRPLLRLTYVSVMVPLAAPYCNKSNYNIMHVERVSGIIGAPARTNATAPVDA
jgi:hypothetical protein